MNELKIILPEKNYEIFTARIDLQASSNTIIWDITEVVKERLSLDSNYGCFFKITETEETFLPNTEKVTEVKINSWENKVIGYISN